MSAALSILLYVYAAVLLLGGVFGYAKAKSLPSLIAGLASAVLAIGAGYVIRPHPRVGSALGFAVAIALSAFFFRRFQETKKPMPALPIIGLSAIVAVASIVELVLAFEKHTR